MASLRIELIALALVAGCATPGPQVVRVPVPLPQAAPLIPPPPDILGKPVETTDDPLAQCVARLRASILYSEALLELLR
jgi:hypothetical protein